VKRPGVCAALVLALVSTACGRRKDAGQRQVPMGDAVWPSAGLSVAQSEVEEVVRRGAFGRVFLPALRLSRVGDNWKADAVPAAPAPFSAAPVVLVVDRAGDLALDRAPGAEQPLVATLGDGLSRILQDRSKLGRVEGVHLDLPFAPAAVESFGALAERLRARLPADLLLTATLGLLPAEEEREDFLKRLKALDGFVVFVFGVGVAADPIAADALGRPWWAGYRPGGRGEWVSSSGAPRGMLAERFLEGLTENGQVSLEHDLGVRQEGVDGFVFRPQAALTVEGSSFDAGDRIAFQQPAVSELMYRFGADLTGRTHVRGRLVVLDGATESQRIFTLEALSDVLLGRPLVPDLRVSLDTDAADVVLSAANLTSHASVVSRTANWVEVDLPGGQIRDVQPGGFDRYEVFDAEGRPVTPGRATRVRFFETLVAPGERIEGAAILLRGRPPSGCCRFREHVLAASGTELAGDWIAPPPEPTPTPKPKGKPRRR
jgi:hypothetical protein